MSGPPSPGPRERRSTLLGRAVWLERVTVAWTVAECAASLMAGTAAHSVALIAFGLQSVVEVIASAAVLARLGGETAGADSRDARGFDERAERVVGWSLAVLSLFIAYEAGMTLWRHEAPHASPWGLVIAAAALVGMSLLGIVKRRIGRALNSRAMIAESTETLVCAYQSFTLLVGLGLYLTLGWWWADPAAALLMIPLMAHESYEAIG